MSTKLFTNLLNRNAQIQRKTMNQLPNGQMQEVWQSIAEIKTRFEPNTAPKLIDGVYQTTIDDFIFFLDTSVDIRRADRIILGDKIYDVIAIHNYDGYYISHHLEVVARYHDHE